MQNERFVKHIVEKKLILLLDILFKNDRPCTLCAAPTTKNTCIDMNDRTCINEVNDKVRNALHVLF